MRSCASTYSASLVVLFAKFSRTLTEQLKLNEINAQKVKNLAIGRILPPQHP
jgi:hypothetical protein